MKPYEEAVAKSFSKKESFKFVSVISIILMTFANNLLNRFMTELLELQQSTDHSKMLSPTKLQKMKWF